MSDKWQAERDSMHHRQAGPPVLDRTDDVEALEEPLSRPAA